MPRSYSPPAERHAAGTVIGHCKNFHSPAGTKATELGANDPIFCAASSSMRRLGAPIASPFRPNGVTIRSQGTKAPVKDLVARDRRSPLTTRRMSRIAKGSYCSARCSQEQALAQIAKSGGLRFRSELPAVRASGRTAGGADANAGAFLTRTRLRYARPH
jgi:predicted transcriptional regulator